LFLFHFFPPRLFLTGEEILFIIKLANEIGSASVEYQFATHEKETACLIFFG